MILKYCVFNVWNKKSILKEWKSKSKKFKKKLKIELKIRGLQNVGNF